jgi:hypothetical protein
VVVVVVTDDLQHFLVGALEVNCSFFLLLPLQITDNYFMLSAGPQGSPIAPVSSSSPKKKELRTRGKLSDGPELISSIRTRSFSFSSVTLPSSYMSPDIREEECSSFRKDEPELDCHPEISSSAPARTKQSKAPWDGFVSIFYSQKKDEAALLEEQKNRSVDIFRPYLKFVQAPYNEAEYRAMMKPPLGGLATIISRDLKRMNSF